MRPKTTKKPGRLGMSLSTRHDTADAVEDESSHPRRVSASAMKILHETAERRAPKVSLRVFVCTDFEGHWPVGTSAVVVAHDEREARAILLAELARIGLPQQPTVTLTELDTRTPVARILQNGDY